MRWPWGNDADGAEADGPAGDSPGRRFGLGLDVLDRQGSGGGRDGGEPRQLGAVGEAIGQAEAGGEGRVGVRPSASGASRSQSMARSAPMSEMAAESTPSRVVGRPGAAPSRPSSSCK